MDDREKLLKALNLSYFYLKIRLRTEHEMRVYLTKKSKKYSFSAEIIEEAIADLKNQGLINDEEFVRWFVERKYASQKKAAFVLKRELARFGVPKNTIDAYFDENTIDEEGGAGRAISSKWRVWATLDRRTRFEKAASYLSRRGFNYDIIKKTIAEMEGRE